MKRLFLFAGLLASTPAFAEPTVVEYGDRIVVEYTGRPSATESEAPKSLSPRESDATVKARGLIALIRSLVTEGNEAVKNDGTETLEQLKTKKRLAESLLVRINGYMADLQKLLQSDKIQLQNVNDEIYQLRACVETFLNTVSATYSGEAAAAKFQQRRTKTDDVKVCCISAVETERASKYVTYSVKADIDNKGTQGDIFVKLVAKNRDGHQVDFVYLRARLDSNESRTLTTTTMLTHQQALDARTWDVDSISNTSLH